MRDNVINVNFTAGQRRKAKFKKLFISLLKKYKNLFHSKNKHTKKPQSSKNYHKSTM